MIKRLSGAIVALSLIILALAGIPAATNKQGHKQQDEHSTHLGIG